jgi:hypothetical protein
MCFRRDLSRPVGVRTYEEMSHFGRTEVPRVEAEPQVIARTALFYPPPPTVRRTSCR